MDKKRNRLWIGLAEIKAINKNGVLLLNGNEHGFVNVIALCGTKFGFRKKAKEELFKYNLELRRLEDVELLFERVKKYKVDESLLVLSKEINPGNSIVFGDFYVF